MDFSEAREDKIFKQLAANTSSAYHENTRL